MTGLCSATPLLDGALLLQSTASGQSQVTHESTVASTSIPMATAPSS